MEFDPQKENNFQDGVILLIDKPYGWTSFNVVSKIRSLVKKKTGVKLKVGHAGTLDPLATGLLVICIGKATKYVESLQSEIKEYVATFHIGQTTPSFDMETQKDFDFPTEHITNELVETVLKNFIGEQLQVPPLFSAKFIDGKRAYKFARNGVDIELKPVQITIHELELLKFDLPHLKVRIKCSKGTYIRALARDIGKALDSGAYLADLIRVGSGNYSIKDAISLDSFENYLQLNVTS